MRAALDAMGAALCVMRAALCVMGRRLRDEAALCVMEAAVGGMKAAVGGIKAALGVWGGGWRDEGCAWQVGPPGQGMWKTSWYMGKRSPGRVPVMGSK